MTYKLYTDEPRTEKRFEEIEEAEHYRFLLLFVDGFDESEVKIKEVTNE